MTCGDVHHFNTYVLPICTTFLFSEDLGQAGKNVICYDFISFYYMCNIFLVRSHTSKLVFYALKSQLGRHGLSTCKTNVT